MNTQQPVKQELTDTPIDVNEIFITVQGEGPFAGRPAIFLRLAGCNIKCHWCDTEYSSVLKMNISAVLASLMQVCPTDILYEDMLVVITGGEPFRQNIGPLCAEIAEAGFPIQIETNGTLSNPDFPWSLVMLVVSPKTLKVHEDIEKHADVYKYVICEHDILTPDGLPVTSTQNAMPVYTRIARPPARLDKAQIYLSPLDSKDPELNDKSLRLAIDFCLKHGYTLSVQVHKYINLP